MPPTASARCGRGRGEGHPSVLHTKVVVGDHSAHMPGARTFAGIGKHGNHAIGTDGSAGVVLSGDGGCFMAVCSAIPPAHPSCLLSNTTLKCR